MSDENTCYYSPGDDKHECCTHQHYCIFNQNRVKLEKKITSNWREYYKLKRTYGSYLKGYYTGDVDYNFLLKKLKMVKSNISRLVAIKEKIIRGDIDGYGFVES